MLEAQRRFIRQRWRRLLAKSWLLARCHYRWHGHVLTGRPSDPVWYLAYGSNMHHSAFRERRGMQPAEWRVARVRGYRLRFNLEGRPRGKAAPANICPDPDGELWGVLYRITRRELLRLDFTEGVPGRNYRHVLVSAEDTDGNIIPAVTYMARGTRHRWHAVIPLYLAVARRRPRARSAGDLDTLPRQRSAPP